MKYLIFLCLLTACASPSPDELNSQNNSAMIECYNGGFLFYKGESSGEVRTFHYSESFLFKDKNDSKVKRLTGNCIITYN